MAAPSLPDRLAEELTRDLAVSVTAAGLALVALLGYGVVIGPTAGGFLLAITIAATIPELHDRVWPTRYTGLAAVAWTVAAAIGVGAVFVAVEIGARVVLAPLWAAGVATLVATALASALAVAVARNAA